MFQDVQNEMPQVELTVDLRQTFDTLHCVESACQGEQAQLFILTCSNFFDYGTSCERQSVIDNKEFSPVLTKIYDLERSKNWLAVQIPFYCETGISCSDDSAVEEICVIRSGLEFLLGFIKSSDHTALQDIIDTAEFKSNVQYFDERLETWALHGFCGDLAQDEYYRALKLDPSVHWWWPHNRNDD